MGPLQEDIVQPTLPDTSDDNSLIVNDSSQITNETPKVLRENERALTGGANGKYASYDINAGVDDWEYNADEYDGEDGKVDDAAVEDKMEDEEEYEDTGLMVDRGESQYLSSARDSDVLSSQNTSSPSEGELSDTDQVENLPGLKIAVPRVESPAERARRHIDAAKSKTVMLASKREDFIRGHMSKLLVSQAKVSSSSTPHHNFQISTTAGRKVIASLLSNRNNLRKAQRKGRPAGVSQLN